MYRERERERKYRERERDGEIETERVPTRSGSQIEQQFSSTSARSQRQISVRGLRSRSPAVAKICTGLNDDPDHVEVYIYIYIHMYIYTYISVFI